MALVQIPYMNDKNVYIHTFIHAFIHTYMHLRCHSLSIYMYIYTYVCMYVCMYVCLCMHRRDRPVVDTLRSSYLAPFQGGLLLTLLEQGQWNLVLHNTWPSQLRVVINEGPQNLDLKQHSSICFNEPWAWRIVQGLLRRFQGKMRLWGHARPAHTTIMTPHGPWFWIIQLSCAALVTRRWVPHTDGMYLSRVNLG